MQGKIPENGNIGAIIFVLFLHCNHWNSGPIFVRIAIVMLSFHRLVSLPYNYKNWNSDLLRPNNKMPPVFLISI